MSHPGIPIDWETVDRLLEAGCDGTQVAAHIGVHPETLYDRIKQEKGSCFSEYKATKRANGDSLLLAKQFKVAMEGDKTMLVWLGKQRLAQTDKRDVTVANPQGETFKTEDIKNMPVLALDDALTSELSQSA